MRSCGYEQFKASPQRAKREFNSHFFRRGVTWEGYVVRVNFNEDNPLSFNYHSANVLIKMELDDREGAHGPDIGLSVSEHMVLKLSDELGALHRGDHVRFNATM